MPLEIRSTAVPSRYAAQMASGIATTPAISRPITASCRVIGRASLRSSVTVKPGLTSELPKSPCKALPIHST